MFLWLNTVAGFGFLWLQAMSSANISTMWLQTGNTTMDLFRNIYVTFSIGSTDVRQRRDMFINPNKALQSGFVLLNADTLEKRQKSRNNQDRMHAVSS